MSTRAGLLVGLLLCVTPLAASDSGTLIVRVEGAAGVAPTGTAVVLTHATGLVPRQTAETSSAGAAYFPLLPARDGYVVAASLVGRDVRLTGISVPAGGAISVVLDPASSDHAGAPTAGVAVDDLTGRPRLRRGFVEGLPYPGRLFAKTLALTPGIRDPRRDGVAGAHGSRSRDLIVVSDGIRLAQDSLTNRFTRFVAADAIEQLVVDPAGVGMAYGGEQGGVVRIVQRDGSNDFQGSLGVLFGSDAFDGDGARTPSPPGFRSVDTSLLLAGPLKRDRLWLRLVWERVDREDPVDVLSGIEVQPTERDAHSHRLTLQASPRNRIAFQYQSDPLSIGGFGVDSGVRPEAARRVDIDSETSSIHWDAVYSPNLLFQTSVAVQRRDSELGPAIRGVPNACIAGVPALELGFCSPDGRRTSGSHYLDASSTGDRLTLAARGVWNTGRPEGRSNQLRFGLEIDNENIDETYAPRPILRPDPATGFSRTLNTTVGFRSSVGAEVRESAVYLEDRFRPVRRLALTLGARVSRREFDGLGFRTPDPRAELEAFNDAVGAGQQPQAVLTQAFTAYQDLGSLINGLAEALQVSQSVIVSRLPNSARLSVFLTRSRIRENLTIAQTDVSPTFSLAWDPWGAGRTQFGFGAGRYHGRIDPSFLTTEALPASTTAELDVVGTTPTLRGVLGEINFATVDRNLESPYQDAWRIFVQRELWPETSLRAEYLQRDYRRQLQITDLNHAPGDFGRCRAASPQSSLPLTASPGSGFELTDPFSGEVYTDTDPGDGDGRVDDCVGLVELVSSGNFQFRVERPDGRDDRYVQNPFWNEVRQLDNANRSDYEAAVLELIRRQHRGWGMTAAYTWSRHGGVADDLEPLLAADTAELEAAAGPQSTHQEHVVRLAGAASLPRGFGLGLWATWGSGLPYSVVERAEVFAAVPPALRSLGLSARADPVLTHRSGSRNDRRNASQWRVDLRVAKSFDLGRRVRSLVALEVYNALDDQTYRVYNPDLELGLQIDDVQHARREFGRRFQVAARIDF